MGKKELIYEKSSPGQIGIPMPDLPVGDEELLRKIPERYRRSEDAALPEITEGELMRHYIGLSVKNHHIDKGFYPLGSCTMKYNPKLNDAAASLSGFAGQHPMAPCHTAEGSLKIMFELSEYLKEISGFDEVSLQPAAGAQGEFAGLLIIRAYHKAKGNIRTKILIPDSAHGTNPASVTLTGYETVQINSNDKGIISAASVAEAMNDDVAGLMLTNPNTLGLFESNIEEIARIVHEAGGLIYMDGANLNAQMGIVQPGRIGFDILHFNLHKTFSTPHGGGGPGAGGIAVIKELARFLPKPIVARKDDGAYFLDYDRPDSIGPLHTFYGNFANIVRAYAYIRTLGPDGIKRVSENAVLNANYIMALVKDEYDIPYNTRCQHEFVLSCNRQKKAGVKALDIAKHLLDFGFHAPTVYFPLIVPEAFMIEPTETESRETLEAFSETLIKLSRLSFEDPEKLKNAPYTTPVRRMNEARAARELDICYKE